MKWCFGLSLVIIIFVAVFVVYFSFDPSDEPLFPKCMFFATTGYKCAGCGMQRAIHSLLHFRLLEALRYNAMFVVSIPVVLAVVYIGFFRNRFPKFYDFLTSMRFAYNIIATMLAWWLLRNVFIW